MQQPLDLSSFVPSVPTPATFWSSFMQQLGNLGGSTSQPPSATKVVVIDTTAPPPNTHNIPPPPQFLTGLFAFVIPNVTNFSITGTGIWHAKDIQLTSKSYGTTTTACCCTDVSSEVVGHSENDDPTAKCWGDVGKPTGKLQ